jgi:hypothetical protein
VAIAPPLVLVPKRVDLKLVDVNPSTLDAGVSRSTINAVLLVILETVAELPDTLIGHVPVGVPPKVIVPLVVIVPPVNVNPP